MAPSATLTATACSTRMSWARGVDPLNWDSDGDGLPDGWEVVEGISPKDNRGQNGANGIPPGRKETNMAKFERLNDDFAPPKPHKARP